MPTPPKRSRIPADAGAWLDIAVMVAIAGFWLGLTAVVALGGGGLVEIALVFVVGGAATFQWAYTSYAWDKLRGRKDGT
jgi:hypothetical protein